MMLGKAKNRKLQASKKLIISIAGAAGLFLSANGFLDQQVFTTQREIRKSRLPAAFVGFKILLLSDIHSIRNHRQANMIIQRAKKQEPDLIVITGDLVDFTHYKNEKKRIYFEKEAVGLGEIPESRTLEMVTELLKTAPVYYVYGNHESALLDNPLSNPFRRALTHAGVIILNNKVEIYEKNGDIIQFMGICDPASITKEVYAWKGETASDRMHAMLTDVSEQLDADKFTILLCHRPEYFETYQKYPLDLAFTGHAHGGHIRIPLVGGLYAPGQGWFPKYDAGLAEKGRLSMLVSRGMGNSTLPFRINNPPEMICVVLKR